MRRRDFIAGFGSAAAGAVWPRRASAQQRALPVIGVLMAYGPTDADAKSSLSAFAKGLAEFGWEDGRNVRIDIRWSAGSIDRMQSLGEELVDLQPDLILANTTPVTAALHRVTHTIPIVFVVVSDPVGAGFVASLPRPGGNITGFVNLVPQMAGKWVQLLTEIAPGIKRIAIMFNPKTAPGGGSYFLPAFEAATQTYNTTPIIAPVHSDAEIELAISSLEGDPKGGLVVMSDGFMYVHRATVISQSTRCNVPVVSDRSIAVEEGGLLSYGAKTPDLFFRAALYVDRILRGAKPADLPVQLPTKFEMRLNVRTAKALGLDVPLSILGSADEVIE